MRVNLFHLNGASKEPLVLPDPAGPVVTLSEKLFVPQKEHPEVSFFHFTIFIVSIFHFQSFRVHHLYNKEDKTVIRYHKNDSYFWLKIMLL